MARINIVDFDIVIWSQQMHYVIGCKKVNEVQDQQS
jgi:hypothetical protein